MLKKLFSHTVLYSFGPQIPRLANLFLLPIITQYLTPIDYGVYGTVMAYNGLLVGVQGLGLNVVLGNSFFKRRTHWKLYWKRYNGLLILWKQVYVLFSGLLLYFIFPDEVGENKFLLLALILIPQYLFFNVNYIGGLYMQLSQSVKRIFITTGISGVVTVSINYYTIVELNLGYLGWYISAAAGSLVIFLSYYYPVYRQIKLYPIFKMKLGFLKKTLRVSLPTIPHVYSSYLLNSSDRLVMDQLNVSLENIGRYNLAYIIGNYFEIFGTAVGMAVGPYYTNLFSRENNKSEQHVKLLTYFLQAMFLSIAILASLWAKQLFDILINNEDLEGVYYIGIIIIMGYSYRPMYWACISKLAYVEKTNQLWKISFVGGTINVVLNLIFIPIYGYEAAAITTMISLLFIGFSGFFLKEFKKHNEVDYHPIRWIVGILLSTTTVYLIRDISIYIKVIISLVIIVVFMIYFMSIKKELNKIRV